MNPVQTAWVDDLLEQMDIKIEVEGLENVPRDGTRYTFASNHPLGAVDGVALCGLISHEFGPMKMLVNDFLLYLKPLAPLCVGINKVGAQARDLPQLIDEAYRSGDHLLMFPAGSCSRKVNGVVQDLPWTKTFITKSVETDRAVVPVHFIGRNPGRFYRADWLFRKFLKIKFNIPMLFLPDALYHAQHKTFRIVFGKPIPADHFDKSRKPPNGRPGCVNRYINYSVRHGKSHRSRELGPDPGRAHSRQEALRYQQGRQRSLCL